MGKLDEAADRDLLRMIHQTIRDGRTTTRSSAFNTMLSKLMTFRNELQRRATACRTRSAPGNREPAPGARPRRSAHHGRALGRAPRQRLQHPPAVVPDLGRALAAEDELTPAGHRHGKPRGELRIPVALKEDRVAVEALARDLPRVKAMLNGAAVRKVIYVPGRVVNLVVS